MKLKLMGLLEFAIIYFLLSCTGPSNNFFLLQTTHCATSCVANSCHLCFLEAVQTNDQKVKTNMQDVVKITLRHSLFDFRYIAIDSSL